ncbi:rubrerythrin family protein [Eggerthellaceae bacterium zg-1084]|uniref:Rubrerythrin family protein n=2 Tax=Berryella wangjianweii TaxID=2734634 RepID=A0A6M8JBD8_9ACTN|nr:rubrerythrin family protein [Berryella wangjianweii]NPD31725.1 rubrerythrin family protein [Eggerthellaceae bacterium zg-997]QKF08042.1 rubrerythrin family protein [Berryella wangjianweii]
MIVREELPSVHNSNNFSIAVDSQTVVGTTLENLKAAVAGETGASAKYTAFAEAADAAGFGQIARLFRATADAEQIHIRLESSLVKAAEPDYERPTAEAKTPVSTDLNLIDAALGEMYETSDMYPAFIQKALEEGDDKAVAVFTRAKLAESVHAEVYLEAYNNLDAADDDAYYLCPGCGYIHKGENFTVCPICGAPKSAFKAY